MEGVIIAKLLKENDRAYADTTFLVIGPGEEQKSQMKFKAALQAAQAAELDLVLVSEDSKIPVCRIMNYGKLMYEQKKKQKEQKRGQQVQKVKELKFRLHIDAHDYECKLNHAKEFLAEGNKLRVTIMFKGRELAHPEMGFELVERLKESLEDCAVIDGAAKLMGKSINLSFNPK